jgi:hypothetical protein
MIEQSIKKPVKLQDLQETAREAQRVLQSGAGLTPQILITCLESLLLAGDLDSVRLVLDQLPKEAFSSPPILSILLRFLVVSGDLDRAGQFASEISRDNPDLPQGELAALIDRILQAQPDLADLSEPRVADYDFDLHDSHYRLIMLLQCDYCGCNYVESTGWGLMVLRPTACRNCLESHKISPDFLVGLLQKYHTSDGQTGLRKIDDELRRLVSNWHLLDEYPESGSLDETNLADPLMWPILRELVRVIYTERYVKSGGELSP